MANTVNGSVSAQPEPHLSAETEVDGLLGALAGAHAALWGYSVLAPHLGESEAARARNVHETLRELRDRLATRLVDVGAEPVEAEAAYVLPFEVEDGESARRLAIHLERGCAEVFGHLISVAVEEQTREFGLDTMSACVQRAIIWGAEPEPFPGMPDA